MIKGSLGDQRTRWELAGIGGSIVGWAKVRENHRQPLGFFEQPAPTCERYLCPTPRVRVSRSQGMGFHMGLGEFGGFPHTEAWWVCPHKWRDKHLNIDVLQYYKSTSLLQHIPLHCTPHVLDPHKRI
jgi:hypothetical protein